MTGCAETEAALTIKTRASRFMFLSSERQRQRQMHDRLAAPFGGARLRANLAERLRILQVHRGRGAEEGPGLHEILEIPAYLELEALIDVDVLLRRNLTDN